MTVGSWSVRGQKWHGEITKEGRVEMERFQKSASDLFLDIAFLVLSISKAREKGVEECSSNVFIHRAKPHAPHAILINHGSISKRASRVERQKHKEDHLERSFFSATCRRNPRNRQHALKYSNMQN